MNGASRKPDCYEINKGFNILDDPTSLYSFLIKASQWDYKLKNFQELTMISTKFCKLLNLSL